MNRVMCAMCGGWFNGGDQFEAHYQAHKAEVLLIEKRYWTLAVEKMEAIK